MPNLSIDIAGPASQVRNGDAVIIWAPTLRKSVSRSGGLISSAPHRIRLDQGKSTIFVEPGPLQVQLQVGGFTDTKPRTVNIPTESPTVQLSTLLGL